ncbi:hypothetical protein [Stakelama marina]|uniref:Uncharacterized protein n=1 Tax=Stakelama marina TaxID=2826939 RepID=A0A8T4IM57_9SPHN|nr:hypothetical protein [Stakelama marina]MBR0553246.1 hypothetical protein [Stakelama marina]
MLPRRPAQIFRSRWSAIFWAVGVIFFALTTIGFAPSKASHPPAAKKAEHAKQTDVDGARINDKEVKMLANLIG